MKNLEKIQELLESFTVDNETWFCWIEPADIADLGTSEAIDYCQEALQQAISEQEITYYSKALEYLGDNDPSLIESLSIAHDMGYEAKDLNSELLATLLLQQNLMDKLSEDMNTFEDLFDEIEEEDDDEEAKA
jgi:hypothetical protein